jgi:diguanylate cyclase (GGDEF)-like protein/PAS domain S-box-containing protein
VLHSAEANFSALIESTEDLIWSVDLEFGLVAFNRALAQNIQLNFGIHAAPGMHPEELFPPERAGLWPPLYRRALSDGPFRCEYPLGDGRFLELSFTPILVGGRATGVSVFGKDISATRQAVQRLAESEARFRSFFEENGSVMLLVDLEGTLISANKAAEDFYGYSKQQLVGTHIGRINGLSGETFSIDSQRVFRKECHSFTRPHRLASGELRDVEVYCSAIHLDGRDLICSIVHDITERTRAQNQLAENREQLRVFVEHTPAAIAMFDDKMNYLHVTRRWLTQEGLGDRDLRGLSHYEVVPDLPEKFKETHRRALAGEFQGGSEELFVRADGPHWYHWDLRPWRRADGSIGGVLLLSDDVTARRLANEALRESEESLREAQTIAGLGSYSGDLRTGNWNLSPLLKELLGVGESYSSTVQAWADIVHPEDRAVMTAYFAEDVLAKRQNFDREYRIVRPCDQAVRWVHGRGRLELDTQGNPIRMRGAIQDITDRKLAEIKLRESEERFRAGEERYRTIFQTSIDAIQITRLDDGTILDVNRTALDFFGCDRDQIVGKTALEIGFWANPNDRTVFVKMMLQCGTCRNMEFQARKRTGETFWAMISASTIELDGVPCILSIIRDISAAKAAEEEIRALAFYDPLTQLPNRRLMAERLRQLVAADSRSGHKGALLFIDIDDFKTLNDTLGHKTGDLLLQEAAFRLTACLREVDTVARLGGDEFVVILEDLSANAEEAATQATIVAEKIRSSLARPYILSGRECLSSSSIGITLVGDRKDGIDELLQQADIAMYQAKAAGRNAVRFFAPELQAAVYARVAIEEELRTALREDQFLLLYQPQVEHGKIVGAEALVRWRHPQRGMVPPNDFIPIAEQTGLIVPIGAWVLESACRQIALWANRPETAPITLAVNISAMEFRQADFVEQVLAILRSTGANPHNLKLELTESMLLENVEDVIAKMTLLKSHGLAFSLDDFGTGYSSLSYLKRLPLDQLKIDRAFVRDMLQDVTSGAIAHTIISLSKAMNLSVIAEGVETEAQCEFLANLGCHCFQGYLFAPPLALEKFEARLTILEPARAAR